jgi:pimeloyl-ACP methyl ester carboxylesterase
VNFAGGLAYELYATGGRKEWLMRVGPAEADPILFVPPLFEEMNRTRAFLSSVMRLLGAEGFGCWLVDLPGTGESELPLERCHWSHWRDAVRDAAHHVAQASGRKPAVASVRGGALLDDAAEVALYWRFAPAEGASLARDMIRASLLKADEMSGPTIDLSGYRLDEALLAALKEAKPAPLAAARTVRLASDRGEADHKLEGPALWRRSEPGTSPELATLIAFDITQMKRSCGVS